MSSTLDYLAEVPVFDAGPPVYDETLVAPIPYFGGKRRAAPRSSSGSVSAT